MRVWRLRMTSDTSDLETPAGSATLVIGLGPRRLDTVWRLRHGLGRSRELAVDVIQPLRGRAETRDPLELLDEAIRAPVDREHVERGREHQRVVVEHRSEDVGEAPELEVIRDG